MLAQFCEIPLRISDIFCEKTNQATSRKILQTPCLFSQKKSISAAIMNDDDMIYDGDYYDETDMYENFEEGAEFIEVNGQLVPHNPVTQ